MKVKDIINVIFSRDKYNNENEEEKVDNEKKYEVVIDDNKICAYYLTDEKKYILVQDKGFPYKLSEQSLEWIEMNKDVFDFYEEFHYLGLMITRLRELQEADILAKKTADDYLYEYLKHNGENFNKIIEKFKNFELDNIQYTNLLEKIKSNAREELKLFIENNFNEKKELNSNRSYEEIKESLISQENFAVKYPLMYEFMNKKEYTYHCGYPDYMWESGVDGTHIKIYDIPNTTNKLFVYVLYTWENNDEICKSYYGIVSEKESKNILKFWNDFQKKK